jgi:methylphosphotriester-DNA--protein-cysteine methyltransferase
MKTLRLTALALVVSFIGVTTTPAANGAETVYHGSSKSDKYHLTSCQWAQKIAPSNLVVFKNKTEATGKGYVPCKVCKP